MKKRINLNITKKRRQKIIEIRTRNKVKVRKEGRKKRKEMKEGRKND